MPAPLLRLSSDESQNLSQAGAAGSDDCVEQAAYFRYGWLKPLPRDFEGERHVVIVEKQLTNSPGIEWCEFEERPGPAPAGLADGGCAVYLMREALDCSDVAL